MNSVQYRESFGALISIKRDFLLVYYSKTKFVGNALLYLTSPLPARTPAMVSSVIPPLTMLGF